MLFNELRNSINTNKLAVFCGAGISFNSGLPIVSSMIQCILKKLELSTEEIDIIQNSNLPFEAFMEILHENTKIDQLLSIFELGEPNSTHILLAKLAKAKRLTRIITTNFDQLIEKALEKEGLKRGNDFVVYFKDQHFDSIEWNDSRVMVIKIHGSVEDRNDMTITLKNVANEMLSEQRKEIIEQVFSKGSHECILVLGYSCSDSFDINPQIEAISHNFKKVIYIDHVNRSENRREVHEIVKKKGKNPFSKFEGSKWFICNTDDLIEELLTFFCPDYNQIYSNANNQFWEHYVNEWYNETTALFSNTANYFIPGLIFLAISAFENAVVHFEHALSASRLTRDKQQEGHHLANLGRSYLGLGEYRKAIKLIEGALSITILNRNAEGVVIDFENLGVAYLNLGNYHKAIEFYGKALKCSRLIKDKIREGVSLGNLGSAHLALGDYHKSIKFSEQALKIAEHYGDKEGEGSCLGNIGGAYFSLGDYHKSIKFFEQALKISELLGDKQREGRWLGNIGGAYANLGEYDKASEFYVQALELAKLIGDKHGEGVRLANLGNVFDSLQKYQNSIKYYQKALSILIPELGDGHPTVVTIRNNLRELCKKLGYVIK